MINLIRKSSDTPNIQNYDDIRAFKYASCGQNGVIKNYLNSCGYEINEQNFTVKSGEIILDGWQVGVDTSGWTGTINNLSGTVYYTVYLEVDTSITGSETAKIAMTYDTVTYPTIDKGQDLSINHMGIGRLELYRFLAIDNTISNVQSVFTYLDGEVLVAKYASNDQTKGTIENRLNYLENQKELLFSGPLKYNNDDYETICNVSSADTLEIHCYANAGVYSTKVIAPYKIVLDLALSTYFLLEGNTVEVATATGPSSVTALEVCRDNLRFKFDSSSNTLQWSPSCTGYKYTFGQSSASIVSEATNGRVFYITKVYKLK